MKKVELSAETLFTLDRSDAHYLITMLNIKRAEIRYVILVHYKDSKLHYFFDDYDNFTGQISYTIDDRLTKNYHSFEDAFCALKEMCAFHLFRFEFVNYDCAEYVGQQLVEALNRKKYIYNGKSSVIGFVSQVIHSHETSWILNFDKTTNHWDIKEGELNIKTYDISSWFDWDDALDGPKRPTLTLEESFAYVNQMIKEYEDEFGPIDDDTTSLIEY